MALAPVPLLQRQLDTTLQLFILLSSNMTADEIQIIRVHLTEASVILGHISAERERNGVIINERLNRPFASHEQHATTPSNNNSGSGTRLPVEPVPVPRNTRPTSRPRPVRRPITRNPAIRGPNGSRPVIIIGTDSSDED